MMYGILLLLFSLAFASDLKEAADYLELSGFLPSSNNRTINDIVDIKEALLLYQESYGLPEDGHLNEETLTLMRRPRCGVKDVVDEIQQQQSYDNSKWNHTNITWHFVTASIQNKIIATEAFRVWANVTNLSFSQSFHSPDILISFADRAYQHQNNAKCWGRSKCNWDFDGAGSVLAHTLIEIDQKCKEIHLDKSEKWIANLSRVKDDGVAVDLYGVLIHEIGHALGLSHSYEKNSIMFAYWNEKRTLDSIDIENIQMKYGKPTTTTTTTTTTRRTTSRKSFSKTPALPSQTISPPALRPQQTSIETMHITNDTDVCNIDISEVKFLVIERYLYIIHSHYLWINDLETHEFLSSKLDLKTYFRFNFENMTSVMQKPNGDIVLFMENRIFELNYPGFNIRYVKNMKNYNVVENVSDVIGSVITNTGRTFIFLKNNAYVELDQNFQNVRRGYISKDFRGIPSNFDSVFRYTNGMLYFLQAGRYFEYNEFLNSLQSSDKLTFNKFNIDCPSVSLYEQLKMLLKKILNKS